MNGLFNLTFFIGLLSQILFSVRMIVQWIASEKARKVLSPNLFWELSLAGSLLFCIYGWMRNDFAILLGQIIAYYVYIWNLRIKGIWTSLHPVFRTAVVVLPCAAVAWFLMHGQETFTRLFAQEDIPLPLILFGTGSQVVFTLRFVYQWWYSRRAGTSLLPVTFWAISLTGSLLIIVYAILRRDPVLLLGQGCGALVYARNIMIGCKEKKE